MKIAAQIITFNPDEKKFISVLKSLKKQVSLILIVDNGSKNIAFIQSLEEPGKISIISLNDNLGIAKATNIGFQFLKENNFDYCILSDQDTIYGAEYINIFLKNKIEDDDNIIAYAPCIYDKISENVKHIYNLKRNRITKEIPEKNCYIFQTIASGLIIYVPKLDSSLLMNEDLFIDMVDFEWCWKVNSKKMKIFYIKELVIEHTLGDKPEYVFGRKVSVRNDIRYYYLIRNCVYLSLTTKFLPRKAKIFMFVNAIEYLLGYLFLANKKGLMVKAFVNGIKGKLGKITNREI